MSYKFTTRVITLIALILISVLSSCQKDEIDTPCFSTSGVSIDELDLDSPSFIATLTDFQKENLKNVGSVFLPEQEKNSWDNIISEHVPSRWGIFELPSNIDSNLRAVGVWGSYPGRYWTMIRVKTARLDDRVRDALNSAVDKIESKTNVRFYNSQLDPEYAEPYHIKLPNVYVRLVQKDFGVSGSFGMSGGEQYIDVPSNFSGTDEELEAFLMHALCNAGGMFNEVQRKDRDDYVTINWNNIPSDIHWCFNKVGKNYTQRGYFDYNSITMPHSKGYSKNGGYTFLKKVVLGLQRT